MKKNPRLVKTREFDKLKELADSRSLPKITALDEIIKKEYGRMKKKV